MKLYAKWLAIPAALISLTGCETLFGQDGYLHDRSGAYREANTAAPMQLPEGYAPLTTPQAMHIPRISNTQLAAGEFEVPRPDQLVVQSNNSNFTIEREGDIRWIRAREPLNQLWTRLQEFWTFNQVEVASRDPRTGEIETAWVQLYARGPKDAIGQLFNQAGIGDEATLDRFRLRVGPGEQAGVSRVELDYINVPQGEEPATADWSRSGDPRVQQAMLNELLVFLGRGEQQSATASSQSAQKVEDYASLDRDGNGNPVLRLSLGYPEAWEKVDQALRTAEIKLNDRNRTAGLFYLPVDADQQPLIERAESQWGGVFAADEQSQNTDTQYQIRVSALGSEVQVSVEQDINTVAPEALAETLLQKIYSNLK